MKLKHIGLSMILLCCAPTWAAEQPMSTQLSANYRQDMEKAEKSYSVGDVIKAIDILKRVAEKGFVPAQVRLGEILDGAEQNDEAVSWYTKAANQGDAAGQFNLGMMHVSGDAGKVDFKKALPLIRKAADQNYLAAVKVLAEAYRLGRLGLSIDLEQAQFWERKIPALEAASKKK